MPNWCDISVVITADTPETKQFLESTWKEYKQDGSGEKDIFDYLQPDNSTRVETWDEDYVADEIIITGQSAWRPPFEFFEYLRDEKNLSVCCEYDERGMGFCGRWEGVDELDEHYDYYDLLPDGWEDIQSLGDEEGDNFNLPDEPVWEKGELIKLESDNKLVYGIVLDCEPFDFNKPDLPDIVIDRGCLDFLDFLDDITIKKRVKIVMTGESRPESAILYVDENGNNNLFVL